MKILLKLALNKRRGFLTVWIVPVIIIVVVVVVLWKLISILISFANLPPRHIDDPDQSPAPPRIEQGINLDPEDEYNL